MIHFSLPNTDGTTVSSRDYVDAKGYIIVFTCNHCPYAVPYETRLKELHAQFAPQGLPLIAISANDASRYPQDSFEMMKIRAAQRGYEFPYLYDESQEVAAAYGAERTPHAFLLRKTGENLELMYKGAIDDNYADAKAVQVKYLEAAADAMLKGEGLAQAETPAVGCTIKWK